jgi:site-specific DNA-cytosine methylase
VTHFSLFTGIGGIDLAAEWAGFTTVGQCEIDPYCRQILQQERPDVPIWEDVRDVTRESVRARGIDHIDLLTGGFPCQPHSLAGKRLASGDERDLWGEMRRVISELEPRWVVGENVPGLLSSESGRFFGGVLRDLAALGYRVGWGVWGACDVGAPHRRDRVFIVGHSERLGLPGEQRRRPESVAEDRHSQLAAGAMAYPEGLGRNYGVAEDIGKVDREGHSPCDRSSVLAYTEGNLRGASGDEGPESFDGCGADVAYTKGEEEYLAHAAGKRCGAWGSEATRQPRQPGFTGSSWWSTEPDVRGMADELSQRMDGGGLDDGHGLGAKIGTAQLHEVVLRVLRGGYGSGLASQGRRSDEQLARELADALRQLPHSNPLGEREATMEAARIVQRLRQAGTEIGALRDTSHSLEAAWQPLSGEEENWIVVAACGGGSWHSEWPGVSRVATGVPDRVHRLRALGNAVVPQQVYPLLKAIKEASV